MDGLLLRSDARQLSSRDRCAGPAARAREEIARSQAERSARELELDLRGRSLSLLYFALGVIIPLPIAAAAATLLHVTVLLPVMYAIGLAVTLPLAAAEIGQITVRTSRRKLELRDEAPPNVAHLRGGLARLARETQTALAVTESEGGVPFGRAIWEWTWAARYLDMTEQQWLSDRGFDLVAVLQELEGGTGRRASQQSQSRARARLTELLEVLSQTADSPYRRML